MSEEAMTEQEVLRLTGEALAYFGYLSCGTYSTYKVGEVAQRLSSLDGKIISQPIVCAGPSTLEEFLAQREWLKERVSLVAEFTPNERINYYRMVAE